MQQYKDLVQDVLTNGIQSDDRTGTGTKSVFGRQIRFDLEKGFPLVTLKKTFWKGVFIELLWIMRGETNIKFLKDHGIRIWDEWAGQSGDLGPVYGKQWRNWSCITSNLIKEDVVIDQLETVLKQIKETPNSRRIIMSAWNVGDLEKMALPPCHMMSQFYVREGKLSCHLYQRSADLFLGVPFNIASYSLLTHFLAKDAGLRVGEFISSYGDLHLYNNHIDQCKEMITREPLALPGVRVTLQKDDLMFFIDHQCHKMNWNDLQKVVLLENYKSHPGLKGDVAV